MYAGIELWGLAPLAWAVTGLIVLRRLGRPRRIDVPATAAHDDDLRRAA